MKQIFLCLCCVMVFSLQAQQQQQQQVVKAKKEMVKIGMLVTNIPLGWKNPSEYCLEDGFLYKGADYRIGDINIHSDNPQDLKGLAEKIVVIYGRMEKDLTKILVKKGKARADYGREPRNMVQIRSDWVTPETGFSIGRSTRERLSRFSFFRYSKVEEFKGFSLKKLKKGVRVSFTNTFKHPLKQINIIAHYESTQRPGRRRSKPRPIYKGNHIDVLYPGQTISLTYTATPRSVLVNDNSGIRIRKSVPLK